MATIDSEAEQAAESEANLAGRSAHGGVRQRMTQRVFGPMIASGAASYVRARDLPKLVALSPEAIEDDGITETERIATRLAALARAQHALGRRRHWSYDMNRHLAILIALRAERAQLAHLRNAEQLARLVAAASEAA